MAKVHSVSDQHVYQVKLISFTVITRLVGLPSRVAFIVFNRLFLVIVQLFLINIEINAVEIEQAVR